MSEQIVSDSPRWGMTVDINRCVGCQTCTISCKHANDTTTGVQWRGVLDLEQGAYPNVQREFLVIGCQHCANPSCVPVCPTGATWQREDGLVGMDYDKCIGCGYCAVSCPYDARTIAYEKDWYYKEKTKQEEAVAHDDRIGVAQKCTFCIDRLDEGLEMGKVPGVDLGYTPACSASCITQAIQFGDFNAPDSNVSQLVANNASFQMHEELGNDPQIKYLYELAATPGKDQAPEELDDVAMSDRNNPLVGKKQTFWDYRAAMNFTLGGMGSGLATMATLGYFYWGITESALLTIYAVAAVLMAVGLFFVFLEISRKLRFLYVLLRPQSSWMTRETYAVVLIYPALLVDFIAPNIWLHGLIGCSAFFFLICQARILFASKGIPAWRVPLIPWLLTATGLLEGLGILALLSVLMPEKVSFPVELAELGVLCAVVTGVLWIIYRRTAKVRGIGALARSEINKISVPLSLIGHGLPVLGFSYIANNVELSSLPFLAAGLGAIFGGIVWKATVITKASFNQGFALPKIPQRGSGTRAAPVRKGL